MKGYVVKPNPILKLPKVLQLDLYFKIQRENIFFKGSYVL